MQKKVPRNNRLMLQRTTLENILLFLVRMYCSVTQKCMFCTKVSLMYLFVFFKTDKKQQKKPSQKPFIEFLFLHHVFFNGTANMVFLSFTSVFDIAWMILSFVLGKRFINFCSLCWPTFSGQHRTNVYKCAIMYIHISVSAFIGKICVGVNGKILKLIE